ncbi:helix-turn-helix domain-containing protein [Pseudotabrizicola formosa]|uniref:helix-turn-helix domain-containing protein n=1 Tax=Pseudotabrizicola formosa TaxID=2030009 RepID=UPI000CD23F07|nr:helix-turn-helix transcriptional regulator [Pseudotabrizicola formosa]
MTNEESLKELGSRIRDKRKQLGMTQEQLAHHAELDRSYVGGIERGERNISFTVLCQVARALAADVATLTIGLPGPHA